MLLPICPPELPLLEVLVCTVATPLSKPSLNTKQSEMSGPRPAMVPEQACPETRPVKRHSRIMRRLSACSDDETPKMPPFMFEPVSVDVPESTIDERQLAM